MYVRIPRSVRHSTTRSKIRFDVLPFCKKKYPVSEGEENGILFLRSGAVYKGVLNEMITIFVTIQNLISPYEIPENCSFMQA